jgi:hypothetical protein
MKEVINNKLNEIFSLLTNQFDNLQFDTFKSIKSKLSAKVTSEKLGISEPMLVEFEEALKQYFQYREDKVKSRISCFRLSLWLETICKNLNISFSIDESISNEEIAIKQVRALELIIRDVVNENLGGKESVLLKLQELFKQDIVEKWLKSADDTGILSGTTFSELSSIFLDKNIFKSIEEIVETSQLKLSKSSRDSLRYILEDIRLIRNSIAHNKKISSIQIEALNEYYRAITSLIKGSRYNKIKPEAYLDLDKANMDLFISGLKEDNKIIITNVEEIKSELKEVKKDTSSIHKKTYYIFGGVAFIIIIVLITLYFITNQSASTNEISKDLKNIEEKIIGFKADSSKYKFNQSVMELYGNNYKKYRASERYKKDLKEFNDLFYESRLASVYSEKSLTDKLNLEWDKWDKFNEISEFYFLAKASAFVSIKDLNNADKYLDTALVLNSEFSPIHYYKSKIFNNEDSVIKFLSKAIELDSKTGFIYLPYRSDAYYVKKDISNSLSDINLYFEKYPSNRQKDLGRKIWQISVMIDGGLKIEGCKEFSNLNALDKEKIKAVSLDAFKLIEENCSKQ